jgi:hypothetical protein
MIVGLAINGSLFAIRMHEPSPEAEPDVLADHDVDGVFILPVNFMVVDCTGRCKTFGIEDGEPLQLH